MSNSFVTPSLGAFGVVSSFYWISGPSNSRENSCLSVEVAFLSITAFVAAKVCTLVFLALGMVYVPAALDKKARSRFGDHMKAYSFLEVTRRCPSPA
jgi:hypothetical protein